MLGRRRNDAGVNARLPMPVCAGAKSETNARFRRRWDFISNCICFRLSGESELVDGMELLGVPLVLVCDFSQRAGRRRVHPMVHPWSIIPGPGPCPPTILDLVRRGLASPSHNYKNTRAPGQGMMGAHEDDWWKKTETSQQFT